jgi:hypothetical protein
MSLAAAGEQGDRREDEQDPMGAGTRPRYPLTRRRT